MNAILNGLNQMAAVGLAALLNTLWYAAAVVALTWIALRYSQRVNAATRYWIWTAVLGFLVVLPFLPALVAHVGTASAVAPATAPLATVPAAPQAVQHLAPVMLTLSSAPGSNPWPLWLMAFWMAVAGWQVMRLLRGAAAVRRLKRRSEEVPAITLPVELQRRVQVLASEEITSPVAVGYRHPAVIVPAGLLATLEEDERKNVLLHELAHLARYDDWLNLHTRAVGALLALHPLAAIVLKQIEREREMACDDFVVAHTGSAHSYARSLARLHDLRSTEGTRLLAPALLGGKVSLADRIESLLRRGRKFSARPSFANLGVSAFLLVLLLAAGGLIPGWFAFAQTAPPESLAEMQKSACAHLPRSFCADLPITFEVASIRPSKASREINIYDRFPGGHFIARNFTADRLIRTAYSIRSQQLEGLPSWAVSRRYTIQANAPSGMAKKLAALEKLPADERKEANTVLFAIKHQMLRSLLAERFKLNAHCATRQLPVYEIVVAKGGPKLKGFKKMELAADHLPGTGLWGSNGVQRFVGVRLAFLARFLSTRLGRVVIDKTGLTGKYDFSLKGVSWRAGMGRAGFGWKPGLAAPADSGLSIFTAMKEQLGLELKATKGPVQVLVVDHISPPTPN